MPRRGSSSWLAADRNVGAASGAVFLLGLGEELWKKFLPKLLESLGANSVAVGFFGTAEDFFDAFYQYPGGWLADHWGRRRAFFAFLAAAVAGYLVYLFSPSWPYFFVGLALTMVWQSMGSPAIFATIGDAVPPGRRAHGFAVQSLLKRMPMVISPVIGGALLASRGIHPGVRIGLVVTLALVVPTAFLISRIALPPAQQARAGIRGVWEAFRPSLKRLLVSDIIIRACEGLADIFVVLYVTNIAGISIARYGVLVSVQLATSILVYLPSLKYADRLGRRPMVIATFLCFALFPLAIVAAPAFPWMIGAFIVGGLREIGEPSRKAMIVDFAAHNLRGRSVGLYYLVRSLAVSPASLLGGLLWRVHPQWVFIAAGIVGIAGTIVFAFTVRDGQRD